jgi:hypothetical protein
VPDDGSGGRGADFYEDFDWGECPAGSSCGDGGDPDPLTSCDYTSMSCTTTGGGEITYWDTSGTPDVDVAINPVVKEIALAACGWAPFVGAGCDYVDLKRAVNEGSGLGVVLGIIGFLPGGDLFKGPRQADNIADAVKGSKKTPDCKCFLGDTDVLMADGTTKDIEDIQLGDKVQATDPETGETGPREVTRLIVTEDDKHFNELSIATEDGVEQLTATHEHPFWSPSQEEWIEAGTLAPGMTLLTEDGDTVRVTGNRAYTQDARTYNLTVSDLHTYYVLAGQTPVLVHNSGGCLPALRDWSSQRFQFGNQAFLLDKKGMEHILTRHHPKYWDGSVKKKQSFFDSSMSVDDVQGAIGQVMRQNRDTLVQRGSQGMYQIRGNVNGVNYVLGMNRGRVGQFYPE